MCASMNVQTPANTECDVTSDSGEGSDSPSQFSYSAIVPPLFLTTSYSNEAISSVERFPTTSSTTPPSTTGSSPSNAFDPHSHASLQATRQGSPLDGQTLKACELCHQQFNCSEQLADHLINEHPDLPNTCGRKACPKEGRWKRRELIRHLDTAKAHRSSTTRVFRCRCNHTFVRREKFRDHFKKFTCKGDRGVVCWCGIVTFDERMGNNRRVFEMHFEECMKGKRGRRRKERTETMQERRIHEGVLTPE